MYRFISITYHYTLFIISDLNILFYGISYLIFNKYNIPKNPEDLFYKMRYNIFIYLVVCGSLYGSVYLYYQEVFLLDFLPRTL